MVITVCNQKGGSTKTTTAAIIARTLAGRGFDVLVVDGDPQGGISALFGITGPGVFDALCGDDPPPIDAGGLRVLPADHRLDKIAYTLPPFDLVELVKRYPAGATVIDTPPTVQGITRCAALAADVVIVPADISKTTIGPTLYTLGELAALKKTGRVVLVGKVPKDDARGFTADLYREFVGELGKSYSGTLPRSIAMQKAAAGLAKVPGAAVEIIRGIL